MKNPTVGQRANYCRHRILEIGDTHRWTTPEGVPVKSTYGYGGWEHRADYSQHPMDDYSRAELEKLFEGLEA